MPRRVPERALSEHCLTRPRCIDTRVGQSPLYGSDPARLIAYLGEPRCRLRSAGQLASANRSPRSGYTEHLARRESGAPSSPRTPIFRRWHKHALRESVVRERERERVSARPIDTRWSARESDEVKTLSTPNRAQKRWGRVSPLQCAHDNKANKTEESLPEWMLYRRERKRVSAQTTRGRGCAS